MREHYLTTPCCDAPVFVRAVNLYYDGESDVCPDCGVRVQVSCDSENPVTVVSRDEQVDNWPLPGDGPWSTCVAGELP